MLKAPNIPAAMLIKMLFHLLEKILNSIILTDLVAYIKAKVTNNKGL
ncbi:hypothetical protein WKK_04580 [Weissella koreensis KACC 15510]|nr:hypothetical protein WKK_04580 [Weissella koreensis KACC 15510]